MPPPAAQTLDQLLTAAVGHFQAGRLGEAEVAFRRVLAAAPGHAGAHYNLAVALKAQGRLDEAAAQYRRTIAVRPDNAKAHNNLGVILATQGKSEAAAAHYRRALAIQPDYANAHYNLANLLREQGTVPLAIDHYRRALAGKPDDAETHNNLGVALVADGRADEAVGHYQRALALRPDYAEAHSNLGAALAEWGDVDEAIAHYVRALALKPSYADAHFNLGHALDAQGRQDEALAHYERALAFDPSHAEAHNNFGFLSQRLGRLDEALARYGRAQALKPDYADAHWNEALARLLTGDFERGWKKYEWRWRRKETPPRALPAPLWDGGDLQGRAILLHAEQGQGDAIQFIRFAPLVKARGGTVVFECPMGLVRLFAGVAGIDQMVPAGAPLPAVDRHAPLLSLPGLLGVTLETIPADIPYLRAEPGPVQVWRGRLAGAAKPKVGLVWRGNPAHANDARRSIPAATMAALVGAADVRWVNLQVDARPEELAAFAPTPVEDAGPLLGDWAETAALVAALDLVVTVDTAVAHLAGALGKPVWLLAPFAPDWRWLRGRSDSPWYPSMRLFRQPAPGDWASVLETAGAALRGFPGAVPAVAAPAVRRETRRLPPAMVVSHERSGTHFLMNALSYAYGYTAEPWIDLDGHAIAVDYADPVAIAEALESEAADPLLRIVKSHHAAGVFGRELERITGAYRVFYVYREPAAVMTSLWRHLNGLTWDEGPKLADPLALARARPSGRMTRYETTPQPTLLRRWAAHVEGWLAAAQVNPRIVPLRYEDLDRRYEQTAAGLAGAVGRAPLTPLVRPPRDVNVIAMGRTAAEAPVTPATAEALAAYCRAEVGALMGRLGY